MNEIPRFLAHLPVVGGMPVQYVAAWINGKVDFRVIDVERQIECYQKKLCAICGGKMIAQYWFIGGPESIESGMFTDGPGHRACAEYSTRVCPFLAGKRTEHSARPLKGSGDVQVMTIHEVSLNRPEKMAYRRASKYILGRLRESQGLVYQVQRWHGQPHWF